jgi:hypothetical protein
MFWRFFKNFGWLNSMMLLLVLSIIVVAEYRFLLGNELEAIFIGLWAPTLLGLVNFLRPKD